MPHPPSLVPSGRSRLPPSNLTTNPKGGGARLRQLSRSCQGVGWWVGYTPGSQLSTNGINLPKSPDHGSVLLCSSRPFFFL